MEGQPTGLSSQPIPTIESDSRITKVIDNDKLWQEFRREMSNSKVFTGMGVSQLSQEFMKRRLDDRVNTEAKERATSSKTQQQQRCNPMSKSARIMMRNSITLTVPDHVGGCSIRKSASKISDNSSSQHFSEAQKPIGIVVEPMP